MIESYAREIEILIRGCPLVVTHEFNLIYLSPATAYIESKILFVNQSKLYLFEFLRTEREKVKREKYRYHYISKDKELLFRYDNAPHYRDVDSFPDHKHLANKVVNSTIPFVKEILEEIEKLILNL